MNQWLSGAKKKYKMNKIEDFKKECKNRVISYSKNDDLLNAAKAFNVASNTAKYSYNFSWLGRPIIQYPQDMIAMQMIISELQPDLIIETGIAHGGSLIYYASLLELIGKGEIIGIDIDIRDHNREAIENHKMFKRISMIEGSSVDKEIINTLRNEVKGKETVMVLLDSNHTHEHVLEELRLYSQFVSKGSYMVCFDTIVESLPEGYLPERSWGVGDNPMTAVNQFLKESNDFVIDHQIDNLLQISVAPNGYLKRIS